MMDYKVTTAPTHEPVSLAETKRHLRVSDTDSDTLIKTLIASAHRWCEQYQNKAWLYQTIQIKLDRFANKMVLPAPPLISVDSITYIDINGVEQTLASTVYDVDTTSEPGMITLAYNQSWPSVRSQHHAITITIKAGHAKTFTAAADTDKITVTGKTLLTNDFVHVYTSANDLPGGLTAATDYYVTPDNAGLYQLSTTEGGSAVDITDVGTGTHYIDALKRHQKYALLMLISDMYYQRRSVVEGPIAQVPHTVKYLLGPGRMVHI
jgi:uncharacterized phiE125 gp8 family phage protein